MESLSEKFSKSLSVYEDVVEIRFPDGETYQIRKEIPIAEKIHKTILSFENETICLLKEITVIQWLLNDTSFLHNLRNPDMKNESMKQLEDEWGRKILKKKRPDLKLDKQWTNMFGQHICEEFFTLCNEAYCLPKAKEGKKPDLEIDKYMIEVKTCTYFTTGTANEKILGTPFKYCDIPELYGKSLQIFCLGGAEIASLQQYGNIEGPKTTTKKKEFLDFFRKNGIEFIAFSEELKKRFIS